MSMLAFRVRWKQPLPVNSVLPASRLTFDIPLGGLIKKSDAAFLNAEQVQTKALMLAGTASEGDMFVVYADSVEANNGYYEYKNNQFVPTVFPNNLLTAFKTQAIDNAADYTDQEIVALAQAADADATTKANNAKSQAIAAAATDASSKANAAQSAAAIDASNKATTAETNAKGYADANERLGMTRNLFTVDEILGNDFSRLTTPTARSQATKTLSGIQLSTPAGTTSEFRYRFAAAQFSDAGVISASVRIVSLEANSGAAVNALKLGIYQTNISGGTLSSSTATLAGSQALAGVDGRLENIALNPSAVYVEFVISLQGATARNCVITALSLLPSATANFVRPVARINQWFDAQMTGMFANTNSGGRINIDTDGQQIYSFAAVSSLQQLVYSLPAAGSLAPGALIRLGAEVYSGNTTSNTLSFVFYDSSNIEISRLSTTPKVANAWEWTSVEAVVPVNTARVDIRLIKDSATTIGKYRNIYFYSSKSGFAVAPTSPQTVLHIDTVNGNDKNNGTRSSPLRTIQRAIDLGGQNIQIILAEGNYFEAPQLTARNINLEVMAQRDSRVWLINNSKITGATKTTGQTKVWQMALATTPQGKHLYQWGTPDADSLILDSERSKYHQGRTHRLPDFTRLWQVASIAAIDAATRPSWFWDSGTLYFSVVGGGSPTAIDVYYNNTLIAPFYGAGTQLNQTLKITGITSFNWLHGFRTWDLLSARFERCRAFGNSGNGFEFSDSVFVERIGCEAGGNGVDGAGAHQYRANPNNINSYYSGSDNWEHDNYDDGESLHERWIGLDVGGLLEYNGDRGIATAVGAHTKHIGTVVRKNGQGTQTFGYAIDDGAGFASIGTAADGGVGTNMELVDCVSDGNVINYNCAGHAANTLDAVNCKAFNATNIQFNASTGTINLIDCGSAGTGTVKNANGGGVINIKNTTTVT